MWSNSVTVLYKSYADKYYQTLVQRSYFLMRIILLLLNNIILNNE